MRYSCGLIPAAAFVLICGSAQAQPLDRPYEFPGLFHHLRQADLVVKVKIAKTTVRETAGKDEWNVVEGAVTDVYQGKHEGAAIRIDINRTALEAKYRLEAHLGRPFYWHQVPWREGEFYVFLIDREKTGKLTATSVLTDSPLVPEYVKASQLPAAEGTLTLVKMMCRVAYGAEEGWYPLVMLYDLQLAYKELDTASPAFKKLVADRRKDVQRGLGQGMYFGYQFSVWLAAHDDEAGRKQALAALVERFTFNEKHIARLRGKKPKLKGPRAVPMGPGGGGIAIDPLVIAESWRHMMALAMEMIRDPSWTRDVLPVHKGDILPRALFYERRLDPPEVLKKVRAFIG